MRCSARDTHAGMYGPLIDQADLAQVTFAWSGLLPHAMASMAGAFFGAACAFVLARWQRLRDEDQLREARDCCY